MNSSRTASGAGGGTQQAQRAESLALLARGHPMIRVINLVEGFACKSVLILHQAGLRHNPLSNGQDLQGLLTLAQAVAAGITGGAGGTAPGTPAPVSAQVLNAAAQGVGGVYGAVQSDQNGNAAGMLAGALEAAAAGAAGIGMLPGTRTQTLNLISAALGSSGIATNMASDFASGNLGQGLLDSLNLYLPAVAQAFAKAQSNQSAVQNTLQADFSGVSAASAGAGANIAPNVAIPNLVSIADPNTTYTTPPIGAVGLTETVQGVTNTVELSQTSATALGQTGSEPPQAPTSGSAPLALEFVPSALANMLGGDAIDTGLSLLAAQIDSATLQVPARISFTNSFGIPTDAVLYSLNGQTFYAPPNTDFQTVFNTGAGGGSFIDIGKAVGQGGLFDFQRDVNGNFISAYTEAANLAVGYYMAGAGFSSTSTYVIGEIYAMTHSSNYLSSYGAGGGNANYWAEAITAANSKVFPTPVTGGH